MSMALHMANDSLLAFYWQNCMYYSRYFYEHTHDILEKQSKSKLSSMQARYDIHKVQNDLLLPRLFLVLGDLREGQY